MKDMRDYHTNEKHREGLEATPGTFAAGVSIAAIIIALLAIALALFSCSVEQTIEPVPANQDSPCSIATLTVNELNAHLYIHTEEDSVFILSPYDTYYITYVVTSDQYDCIGWLRVEEDFIIEIWNSHERCSFVVPGLSSDL